MEINPFSATLPKLDTITSPDDFFQSVKEQYLPLSKDGFFYSTHLPSLYVQQITSPKHDYLGIIASVPVEAFRRGQIKGHEETLEHKGRIQVDLLRERQAMVKPVLLTYNKVEAIQNWMLRQIDGVAPLQHVFFEQDQAHYKLWAVQDQLELRTIQSLFREEVARSYIADGHHRMLCATAEDLALRAVLCAFYPEDQVLIRDFNRQVFYPENFEMADFLGQLRQVADLTARERGAKPQRKHELSLYLNQQWYGVRWKASLLQGRESPLPLLDSALLNDLVLKPLLGVDDLRKTDKVKYIDGQSNISQLEQALRQDTNSLLFCLYPVSWSEMVQWADQGRPLPPKSTWFEPRMKNGLVVKEL